MSIFCRMRRIRPPKGLKEASEKTQDYAFNSCMYNEIFYDRATGEVWTVFQCSLGHNTWTKYHDENIIKVCNATEKMSMQYLADLIAEAVAEEDLEAAWEAEIERQYRKGLL